jgi:hypothetical protein
MTTRRTQIKRMLAPLAERHPDLAMVGRYVHLKPVRHLVRYVVIDTLLSPGQFRPRWIVFPLCIGNSIGVINPGEFIDPSGDRRLWYFDDPTVGAALRTDVEAKALPQMQEVADLPTFDARVHTKELWRVWTMPELFWHRTLDAAMGRLQKAREGLERLFRDRDRFLDWGGLARLEAEMRKRRKGQSIMFEGDFPYTGSLNVVAFYERTLYPLVVAEDRAGIGALLRSWEEVAVKAYKIEHLWEPTPLPVETGGGA